MFESADIWLGFAITPWIGRLEEAVEPKPVLVVDKVIAGFALK